MTKRHLVEVEWLDACSNANWAEDVKPELMTVHSVGYLLDNKRILHLAQSLSEDGKTNDRLNIPKACVKRMKRLR